MSQSITFVSPESGPNPPESTPTPDQNRPEWLDPKFKSVEDQAKAYAEAQAELTRTKQEIAKLKGSALTSPPQDDTSQVNDNLQQDDIKADAQDKAAQRVAEAAGLDLNLYQQEFFETGDVSAESRAKIVERLSQLDIFKDLDVKSLVDDYIEGKKALIENDRALYMEEAGGEAQYEEMIKWAAENLPRDEIEAYNRQVSSGDRHATLFAIRGLRAKFEAANGRSPSRLYHGGGGSVTPPGFRSSAEMVAAMRDPRYKTDPSYREEVRKRLAVSNF